MGRLEEVALAPHAFRRFGGTRITMYDTGQDPVSGDWLAVVISVNRPVQVGTPKQFKAGASTHLCPASSGRCLGSTLGLQGAYFYGGGVSLNEFGPQESNGIEEYSQCKCDTLMPEAMSDL
jgi:hypothetical protein